MKQHWKKIIGIGVLSLGVLCSCAAQPAEQPQQQEAQEPASAEQWAAWLPEGVTVKLAEREPNQGVQEALIQYYEIPEDSWKDTRYYYNYVDFDGDGTEEIFTVALGAYTSGSGCSSALWLDSADFSVKQAFTLVNTPIIVTAEPVQDGLALILQRDGGGAAMEFVQLICTDGVYTNVADAAPLADISVVTGTAILANDLIADLEQGTYLTLAD